jgi:hypothetical protein
MSAGNIYRTNATLGFGSITIVPTTGAGAGRTYILENWTPTNPAELAERKDNLNRPNGAVQVEQAATAQATAQLENASTPALSPGDEFVVDGITYFVREPTAPKEQNGIWKFTFTARQKI